MIIGMLIIIVYLFWAPQEPHDWAVGSPTGAEHVAVPVNPDEFSDPRPVLIINNTIVNIVLVLVIVLHKNLTSMFKKLSADSNTEMHRAPS